MHSDGHANEPGSLMKWSEPQCGTPEGLGLSPGGAALLPFATQGASGFFVLV